MNFFDIFTILILGFGLIRGIIRGAFGELSSVVGISLGFYVACCYYNALILKLPNWLSHYYYINILSFLSFFFIVTSSISFLSLFINHIMNLNKIGKISRTCGGFFGLLEGSLFISIFILVAGTFFPKNVEFIKNSHLYPYLIRASETAAGVAPNIIRPVLFSRIKNF